MAVKLPASGTPEVQTRAGMAPHVLNPHHNREHLQRAHLILRVTVFAPRAVPTPPFPRLRRPVFPVWDGEVCQCLYTSRLSAQIP